MRLFGREQWDELWYTLRNNKRRSLVTSLGVFAGMFFFTVLIGLGIGISNSANNEMSGLSSRAMGFVPGRTTVPYEGFKANRLIVPNYRDYISLKRRAKTLQDVEATVNFRDDTFYGNTPVFLNNKSKELPVFGISEGYAEAMQANIVRYGRDLRRDEIELAVPVAVIGMKAAEYYFEDVADAVGQHANIAGIAYQIVGVVQPFSEGSRMNFDVNETIQIPLMNAVKNDMEKFIIIMVNPQEGISEEEARDEAFSIMASNHNVHPDDTNAIIDMRVSSYMKLYEMIEKGLFILIWLAGMGTLISGVIGVSNILLVTVRERQREIGVRRAIGAKPRDITAQFMAESIAIILLSGSAGSLLGMLVTLLIGEIATVTPIGNYVLRPYPTVEILIFSAGLMILAGVLAGLLPVQQALKIKAIDAIRDE